MVAEQARNRVWRAQKFPYIVPHLLVWEAHRRLLRTTNSLERINQEVRRRTSVVGNFPNGASCLRLVSAVLMEIRDEREVGRAYLTFA